ncbi:MAG: iron-containing alcohol dehydrogenase [Myxococcales bacterium]|nr:iron-containing alcohol dehydrogenase [Myxococcales bacterium]
MVVRFSFPTQIVFGEGALAALPELLDACGGTRVLVVTDRGLVGLPPFAALIQRLDEAQIPHALFDGVHPNPKAADVVAGVEAYHVGDADSIISIGGGSAIDGAKAIQLMTTHGGSVIDYDDALGGSDAITDNLPPHIAIPTTAGTGSEVGRSTVITDPETNTKKVIFSPFLIPDVALIDPQLMRTLPPPITAATGMDALAHNVEAYLALGLHPMCDAIALEGVRRVARYLARAVESGDDMEARSEMALASMMGAVAFQKGLGVCHSLAHPLSTICGMHHGLANGILLANVVRFNAEVVPDRVTAIGRAFGVDGVEATLRAIDELAQRVGIPRKLTDVGVSPSQLQALADQAIADGCHQSNPRPVSREQIVALYQALF